ncbi:MAG: hypothetical protein KDD99_16570, partial [Bacteroidetes bacterium]|nr:hypothetical protein [Bacteroidota bacterium]
MKRTLLILFLVSFFLNGFSQTVYEDFESGAALSWNALNGTFDGVFANPDQTGINTSDSVGSYTKSDMHAYSLFLVDLGTPMDLSVDNQFSIQINAPVASQFILKLEGPSGNIEATQNIPQANVWREYTFDFSSASGATDFSKIILFFDPGNASSGDTYLFDNLVANPAGPCAGTVPMANILDDFECQRNVTYGVGWDSLSAVANPDAFGINTSSMVGQYIDPQDQWSALVVDYHNPIDLGTDNLYKAKVWSPKTGQMLFKLEGGASAPYEVFVDITTTNQWVEYEADFSSQSNANHKKLAIFFNAGVMAAPGDIYYIDDITREPAPTGVTYEDFEPQKLGWGPLNSDPTVHGSFNGVVTNPDMTGSNTSANVGSYNKGTSTFSTLTAPILSGVDLSQFTQLNLQVLPPAGAAEVALQLSSPTQGVKEVIQPLSGSGGWEDLSFDFVNFTAITDFDAVNIIFDPGVNNTSTFYFDNLFQGESTVDPCEGVVAEPNIADDFECQRNVAYGAGADRLEVIDNPDVSNGNPSTKVGEYTDVLDEWSALVLDYGQDIDLSVNNQFHIKIWSSVAVPLKFKLEGGSSGAIEIDTMVMNTGSWEDYTIDFSPYASESHQRVAIFFNAGVLPSQEDVYYIDDLTWSRAGYTGCMLDYEAPETTIESFTYFANGHLETSGYMFQSVANPDPSGINTSSTVGEFVKASDALPFAGMYADLGAPIDFDGNPTIRAKVYMDHIGNFAVKLEGSQTGASPIELPVANTKTNEWEELTFDFSSAPNDAEFTRLTLFFDLSMDSTGTDVYSYFDELVVGNGMCDVVGINDLLPVRQLEVYPNPVSQLLYLEN